MRWLLYLLLYIPVQLFAYLITPLLPLFAVMREGPIDNASYQIEATRLPLWLSWFDTPDNSLDGGANHLNKYIWYPKYLRHMFWLYRNSLYGFKWTVLAVKLHSDYSVYGNPRLNYHSGQYGWMGIKMGWYWQFKIVKRFGSCVFIGNFGWLLDDQSQTKALWMFSPRFKKV